MSAASALYLPNATTQFKAVHLWHVQIAQNKIEMASGPTIHGSSAVAHNLHFTAQATKLQLEDHLVGRIVFGNQYPWCLDGQLRFFH